LSIVIYASLFKKRYIYILIDILCYIKLGYKIAFAGYAREIYQSLKMERKSSAAVLETQKKPLSFRPMYGVTIWGQALEALKA